MDETGFPGKLDESGFCVTVEPLAIFASVWVFAVRLSLFES